MESQKEMDQDVEKGSLEVDDCVIIEKPAQKAPECIQLDSDDETRETVPKKTKIVLSPSTMKSEYWTRDCDPMYTPDPKAYQLYELNEKPNLENYPTPYLQEKYRKQQELLDKCLSRIREEDRLEREKIRAEEMMKAAELERESQQESNVRYSPSSPQYSIPSPIEYEVADRIGLYEISSPQYSTPTRMEQEQYENKWYFRHTATQFPPPDTRVNNLGTSEINKEIRHGAPAVNYQNHYHQVEQSTASSAVYGIKTNRNKIFDMRDGSSIGMTTEQYLVANRNRLPIGNTQSYAEMTHMEEEQCDEEIRIVFAKNLNLNEMGEHTGFANSPQPTFQMQQLRYAIPKVETPSYYQKRRDCQYSGMENRRDTGKLEDSRSTRYRQDSRHRDVEYPRHRQNSESSRRKDDSRRHRDESVRRGERRHQKDHSKYSSYQDRDRDVEYPRHRHYSESSRQYSESSCRQDDRRRLRDESVRRGERRLQEDQSRRSAHQDRNRVSGFRRSPVDNYRSERKRHASSPVIEATSNQSEISVLRQEFGEIRVSKRGIVDTDDSDQPPPKRPLPEVSLTEEQKEYLIANGIPDLREIEAGTASYIKSERSLLTARDFEELARLQAITLHARSLKGKHPIPVACVKYVDRHLDKIIDRSGCKNMRIGKTTYASRYRYVDIRGEPETIENARRELDAICLEDLEEEFLYNEKNHRQNSSVFFFHCIPEECINRMRKNREFHEACRRASIHGVQLSHQTHPATEEDNPPMEMRGLACNIRQAKESLNEYIQELVNQKTVFIELPLDNFIIGALIGTKGSNIRLMEIDTKASIYIDTDTGTAEIDGEEKAIEKAKNRIEQIIERQQKLRIISVEMEISSDFVREIIGKRGVVIQRMRSITGAGIYVPRDSVMGKTIVTISGNQEQVKMAQNEIGRILDQINHRYRGRSPSPQHSPGFRRSSRISRRDRYDGKEEEQSYQRQNRYRDRH